MKLFFLFLLLSLPAHSALGGGFEGCEGLKLTRSRDFSQVDVSADLKKAQKRIKDICGKSLLSKLKSIDSNAKSCVSGSRVQIGPGIQGEIKAKVESQMAAFDRRVKEACEAMKESLEDSEQFCASRGEALAGLSAEISAIGKSGSDQASSQKNVSDLYGRAGTTYRGLAKAAGETKNRIYSKLPDKDERRSEFMRTGKETASTMDVKTDKLVAEWKATLLSLAEDNSKKAACLKLGAKGGQLDEMSGILKNNLWPNGKVAARAMARIESADNKKMNEFGVMKSEADRRLASSKLADGKAAVQAEKSDISGTEEGMKPMSEAEASRIRQEAQNGANLQQKAVEACQKKGGCHSEGAVWQAIKEAQASKEPPMTAPPSPVQQAAGQYSAPAASVDQPGILDDLKREPASMVSEVYVPPQVPCLTSVWSWSRMWYVQTVGVKNAAGECVAN